MACAARCSTVLIPGALQAFLLTTFGSVDAQTGKIEMRKLLAITSRDKFPVP